MTKKMLYCASTVSHILNFHVPYLQAFHEMGYEVWVAADKETPVPYADHVIALPFRKKITSPENIRAVFAAVKLMREQKFDFVSTHTMLASAVVRAAVLLLYKKPKVACTVHGYLFHEEDGIRKWIYLLPEKLLAHITNILMVMNHEDYEIAQKHKLYKDNLYYIDGMGIDLGQFKPATHGEHNSARKTRGILEDEFVYVYAAEFSKRKNQEFLIRAFADICKENPRMKLFLAGSGALLSHCKELAHQLGTDQRIRFLGYVKDMRNLYAACDACVSVSRIEGLPFNLMEAMACGLPVIASDIKGHRELAEKGGALFRQGDSVDLEREMLAVFSHPEDFREKQDLSQFGIETVLPQILKIYREAGL